MNIQLTLNYMIKTNQKKQNHVICKDLNHRNQKIKRRNRKRRDKIVIRLVKQKEFATIIFLHLAPSELGGMKMVKGFGKTLAQNKRARHDYFIEDTYEAGIVLQGTEIKSIRNGRVNLKDSHAMIDRNGEVQLVNMHIAPYEQGNRFNHEPTRSRKLLLHRKEIDKLIGQTQQQGYTLVPLKVYIKNGVAKVLIGLGKGKKRFDKREDLKQKQMKRDIDRAMKEHNQG